MNSHDVGRGRKSAKAALGKIKAKTMVIGIDSDRLFPIENQKFIAENLNVDLVGGKLHTIKSSFGHDGFLIEYKKVGPLLAKLLRA
jgi:homoserine O-acetyltransferase